MSTPTTVGPTDVNLNVPPDCVQNTFQRKSFFALGRHWVFYVNAAGFLVYDSSVGASGAWLGAVALTAQAMGPEFSLWLQDINPTTSYIHLVRADSTGNTPIYYHRGTLASNGTIVWDAEDEAVPFDAGWEYEKLGICMDWSGNLYVVYNKVSTVDPNICTPYVCQSTTYDGTWTTGAGYPLQMTAVQDASWVPLVSAYGTGVMVVYAADGGNIYSRVQAVGIFYPQVDSGFDQGADARAMSIVSESIRSGLAAPTARAVYIAFQAIDWDLHSIRYEDDAWQGAPASIIQAIGNFREASPMLTILDTGTEDEDPTPNHPPATLYCFWTPTTDSPHAEYVTYRVSRDLGDTWTNEAEADAAVSWIDETADGFEVQASGSAYYFSSPDYDNARSYVGLVYVTHRMPPALRHAALGFDDPDEDLHGDFIVQQAGSANLLGEFIAQHASSAELKGEFIAQHADSANLLGIFNARHTTGAENLLGIFIARHDDSTDLFGQFSARRDADAELLGIFNVQHADSEDLYGMFNAGQDSADLKGVFVAGQWAEDLKGIFNARRDGTAELKGQFEAAQQGDEDFYCLFFVRNAGDADLLGIFNASHADSEDLKGQFDAQNTDNEDLLGIFNARQADTEDLYCIFVVRHTAVGENLPAQFRIDADYISKGLNASVYRDLLVIG